MNPYTDIEEARLAVEQFDGSPADFLLPVSDELQDTMGIAIAIVTDAVLAKGWPRTDSTNKTVIGSTSTSGSTERPLLAESGHSHPPIFRVASVRFTPIPDTQVLVFILF